jgi:nitroimidazol reductase NimA-like FMN-containing flavoprotein (pyridoxamine 5'-phosphate oxidase superfamily)
MSEPAATAATPPGTAGPARTLEPSARTMLRRKKERGRGDWATITAILDEGLLCHVGFNDGTTTYVTPMAYARVDDALYLHGAPANRTLRALADGTEACVTVTLLDGLVLARSAFHHSMNYRCVVLLGTAERVEDEAEQLAASKALLDHMAPGRGGDARLPTPSELRSTLIVRFPISEGSAKVRTGGPIDDEGDMGLPVWAGVVPFRLAAGEPVADDGLPEGVGVPPYAARHRRPGPA